MPRIIKDIKTMLLVEGGKGFHLLRHVRKNGDGRILVLHKSRIVFSDSSHLCIKKGASLTLNRQDFPLDKGESCRLQLSHNATLSVVGHVTFHGGTRVILHDSARLLIGGNTYLNGASIDCSQEIAIGKDCAIASGVKIMDNTWHDLSGGRQTCDPIIIGNHVWIATNAIILPGVKLGDGCVVAAGAVVTHDVPDKCLVAGVPAKIVRENVQWTH